MNQQGDLQLSLQDDAGRFPSFFVVSRTFCGPRSRRHLAEPFNCLARENRSRTGVIDASSCCGQVIVASV